MMTKMIKIVLTIVSFVLCLNLFAEDVRVGTFNLDGYPNETTNDTEVWNTIDGLNVDVLVVQGVSNPTYFKSMVQKKGKGKYKVAMYPKENTWRQKICFVYKPSTVELLSKVDAFVGPQIDAEGKFHVGWKPAHHVYVKASEGFDFHLIGVHMAAKDGDEASRKQQWESVYNIIYNSLPEDEDIMIMGDFNCYEGYKLFDTLTKKKEFYHITPYVATNCLEKKYGYVDNILVSKGIYEEEFQGKGVEVGGFFKGGKFTCEELASSDYAKKVSSHLPLVASFDATDNDPRLMNGKVTLNHQAVIGNKYSKVYYHPRTKNLPQKNIRVYFVNRMEAEKSGYRPSKNWDWQGKVKK